MSTQKAGHLSEQTLSPQKSNRFSKKLMVNAGVMEWKNRNLLHWPTEDQSEREDLHRVFEDILAARMPPSVSWQWFHLHARQHSVTPCQSNSSRQHARFHQLTRMDIAFARSESTRFGTYCKYLSTKEGVNCLQTSKILRLLSETNGMMSMIRQWEKLFCSGKKD